MNHPNLEQMLGGFAEFEHATIVKRTRMLWSLRVE